jgi:hypothetical protein
MVVALGSGGLCGSRAGDQVLDMPFSGRIIRLVGLPTSEVKVSLAEGGLLMVRAIWPRHAEIRLRAIPVETFVDGPRIDWRGDVVQSTGVFGGNTCSTGFEPETGTVIIFRDGPAYAHMYRQALDAIGGAGNEERVAMLATILCEEVARIVVQSLAWRFLCPGLGGEDGIAEVLLADALGDAVLRTRIAQCWRCSSEEGGTCSIAVNGGASL